MNIIDHKININEQLKYSLIIEKYKRIKFKYIYRIT